jgi:RNA polymerase sigma-70 factor (ECF subfamily)
MNADRRFSELYDRFYNDVYAYVFRRTNPDQVEDVVAGVFLTAWRKIDEVPDGPEALFWLYRVAYRAVGTSWRSASRRQRLRKKLEGLGAEPTIPPEDFVVQDEESRLAIEATKCLRDSDREVLLLSVWEQLSHPQIAEILGTTAGAVKQRLYRARRSFADEFYRLSERHDIFPTAREGGSR